MLLAEQPPDQRSALFGPLVLEKNLLKNQRLQQIKTNLSHAMLWLHLDYIFIRSLRDLGWLTFSLYGVNTFLFLE